MSVRFHDTDPRPMPDEGRGVSPGFARQRAERQRAADEATRDDRLAELGRGLASLVLPGDPERAAARKVHEIRAEAARRYPFDGTDPDVVNALRDAYVGGYLDGLEAQR